MASALPQQILSQSEQFGYVDESGRVFIDINWYLLLYNISSHVLGAASTQGGGTSPSPISSIDLIAFVDLDAAGTDVPQAYRQDLNTRLLQDVLPDPVPQAQPAAPVTVGASPYTWSAPFTGCLSITGGTVSAISIIRQGTTVATGITAGLVPVSKLDQVKITYSVLPTVVFLPT